MIHIYRLIKKNIFLITTLGITVVLLCFIYIGKPAHSLNDFFLNKDRFNFNHLVYFLIVFFPLVFYIFSDGFRNIQGWHNKLLMLSLAIFFISTIYKTRYSIDCTVILYISAFIYLIKERLIYKPTLYLYLFFIYFTILAISCIWTPYHHYAMHRLGHYWLLISLPVTFLLFKLSTEQIHSILKVFFRAVFIYVLICDINWLIQLQILNVDYTTWIFQKKPFFNGMPAYLQVMQWAGNYQSTFQAFAYIIASASNFYFIKQKTASKAMILEFIVFSFLAFLLILISHTRYGLLMFIITYTAGFAWLLNKNKKWNLAYISTICLAGCLLLGVFHKNIKIYVSDPIRKLQLITATNHVLDNPLKGTGFAGMTYIFEPNYCDDGKTVHEHIDRYPANQFLGDFLQSGIFALIAIMAIMSYLLYIAIKRRNWLIFIFFVASFFLMLIEMPIYIREPETLFISFYCLFMQMNQPKIEKWKILFRNKRINFKKQ